MKYLITSTLIALCYLMLTALASPFEEWWWVTDSPVYAHAGHSILDGRYESVAGNEQLRFARPPLYPAVLAATGATSENSDPWLALIWNAWMAGLVGWGVSKWIWLRHRWAVVLTATVICLPHVPMIHSDMTAVGLMTAAVGLYLMWPEFKHCWAGSLVLGLSIVTRQTSIGFLPVVGLGAIYLLATPATKRNWKRLASLVLVPLILPAAWAGYVYSQTGAFTIASHDLSNNLYLRFAPGVIHKESVADAVAATERITETYFDDVPRYYDEGQRMQWDFDSFMRLMEGHWLDVPEYTIRTISRVIFSSPSDWQTQFGPVVNKSLTRPLYALMGVVMLLGAFAYAREIGLTWHIAALMSMFAMYVGLCVVVGAAISQRHMLPAVLARAVFYVYGVDFIIGRMRWIIDSITQRRSGR